VGSRRLTAWDMVGHSYSRLLIRILQII
jgi:hypothetical protein